jgi:signal transduction histidine kinase
MDRDRPAAPPRSDWLIVAALIGYTWLAVFVAHDLGGEDFATVLPRWLEYVLAASVAVPLAWRRIRPLIVLTAVTTLCLVFWGFEIPEQVSPAVAFYLALYTAGAYSDHRLRDRARGLAVAAAAALVVFQLVSQQRYIGFDAFLFATFSVVANIGYFILAWIHGDATRRHHRDRRELADKAERLAAEQRARARRAVLDERLRIARELHDVVAHHVSVMGVQAGAARRVLEGDPDRAARMLSTIESSGREAVAELQRVVGFLRAAEDGAAQAARAPDGGPVDAPQPSLGELEAMVAGAGLPARVQHVGQRRSYPAAIELSAFRIVQEALTNTLKHAGTVDVVIVLAHRPDALGVEIVNERGGLPREATGTGRGIVGMRERVAMLGGTFTHGPTSGGGYRVAAVLPVAAASTDAPPVLPAGVRSAAP